MHLGREDLETTDLKAIQAAGLRTGVSTHDKCGDRRRAGGFIPYRTRPRFPQTSGRYSPAGAGGHINRLADYPTVAIGGISLGRAPSVLATGVGSIAVVSAITQAADWQAATAQLLDTSGSRR
ncbi:thiamine phosphate synthase [Citrobacter freundii]|uniref:thiamine phosphate synthase n=1 Tax=Citrobacter freundii TaxID=546 RepID=UPI00388D97A8